MAGRLTGAIMLGILFLTLTWGCISPQKPKEEFGIIHMERLVAESFMAQHYQELLDIRGREIQEEYEAVFKDLDDFSRSQKQQESYRIFLEYKEELEEELNAIIEKHIEVICQELNILVVLDKESVRYGGYDITDEVLKALEKEM